MGWATFWAFFSQTHLVTLLQTFFGEFLSLLRQSGELLPPHGPVLDQQRRRVLLGRGRLERPQPWVNIFGDFGDFRRLSPILAEK
jgi:hypothetical protein